VFWEYERVVLVMDGQFGLRGWAFRLWQAGSLVVSEEMKKKNNKIGRTRKQE
jgi:hypothetical protein